MEIIRRLDFFFDFFFHYVSHVVDWLRQFVVTKCLQQKDQKNKFLLAPSQRFKVAWPPSFLALWWAGHNGGTLGLRKPGNYGYYRVAKKQGKETSIPLGKIPRDLTPFHSDELSQGSTTLSWFHQLGIKSSIQEPLEHWFSTFRMLRPFSTVPHGGVTPNHEVISLPPS